MKYVLISVALLWCSCFCRAQEVKAPEKEPYLRSVCTSVQVNRSLGFNDMLPSISIGYINRDQWGITLLARLLFKESEEVPPNFYSGICLGICEPQDYSTTLGLSFSYDLIREKTDRLRLLADAGVAWCQVTRAVDFIPLEPVQSGWVYRQNYQYRRVVEDFPGLILRLRMQLNISKIIALETGPTMILSPRMPQYAFDAGIVIGFVRP